MPITEKYQTIFIHIPKTGGSSLETVLGIHGRDNRGSVAPAPEILFGIEAGRALQHLTAAEIKKRISREVWENYFKFAFVRNPFDRLVSEFFWQKNRRQSRAKNLDFKKFLLEIVAPAVERKKPEHLFDDHYRPQNQFLVDRSNRLLINFLGRFENFQADFEKIRQRLGLTAKLPRLNQTNHQDYRRYYNQETREIVNQLYRSDLKLLNYSF